MNEHHTPPLLHGEPSTSQRLAKLDVSLAELNESLAKHTQATALAAEVVATRLETLDITAQLIAGILARDGRAEAPKLTQLSAVVQWHTGDPPNDNLYLVAVREGRKVYTAEMIDEFVSGDGWITYKNVVFWAELPEPPADC